VDARSYFVIEKKIKEVWEDWVVFNEDTQLDEVVKIYDTKKDKEQFRIIKRTDKVLHLTNPV